MEANAYKNLLYLLISSILFKCHTNTYTATMLPINIQLEKRLIHKYCRP